MLTTLSVDFYLKRERDWREEEGGEEEGGKKEEGEEKEKKEKKTQSQGRERDFMVILQYARIESSRKHIITRTVV